MRGVLYTSEISSLVHVFLGAEAFTASSNTDLGVGEGGAVCGIAADVRGTS